MVQPEKPPRHHRAVELMGETITKLFIFWLVVSQVGLRKVLREFKESRK